MALMQSTEIHYKSFSRLSHMVIASTEKPRTRINQIAEYFKLKNTARYLFWLWAKNRRQQTQKINKRIALHDEFTPTRAKLSRKHPQ